MDEVLQDFRRRAVGTKQALKLVARGMAEAVYVASDAEEHVIKNLVTSCRDRSVPVIYVETMTELGRACGIKVGAASAALIRHQGGAELADD
ncbi:MAG: ribosomal L7Ae/L30e/S12e/Gadd45 family protein [Thermaerobacterales bacterium]